MNAPDDDDDDPTLDGGLPCEGCGGRFRYREEPWYLESVSGGSRTWSSAALCLACLTIVRAAAMAELSRLKQAVGGPRE